MNFNSDDPFKNLAMPALRLDLTAQHEAVSQIADEIAEARAAEQAEEDARLQRAEEREMEALALSRRSLHIAVASGVVGVLALLVAIVAIFVSIEVAQPAQAPSPAGPSPKVAPTAVTLSPSPDQSRPGASPSASKSD